VVVASSLLRILVCGALLSAGTPAIAGEGDLRVPGGRLDPAFPDADVYIDAPTAAKPPPGAGCEVAARYVQMINAGDFSGVAGLYADDATFLEPMRPTLRGRKQIDDFYTKRIGSLKPSLVAVSYLGHDRECFVTLTRQVEIEGRQRYVMVSADLFEVDGRGKIVSMVAFARPPRAPREGGAPQEGS
jgi:hypothetical protein